MILSLPSVIIAQQLSSHILCTERFALYCDNSELLTVSIVQRQRCRHNNDLLRLRRAVQYRAERITSIRVTDDVGEAHQRTRQVTIGLYNVVTNSAAYKADIKLRKGKGKHYSSIEA